MYIYVFFTLRFFLILRWAVCRCTLSKVSYRNAKILWYRLPGARWCNRFEIQLRYIYLNIKDWYDTFDRTLSVNTLYKLGLTEIFHGISTYRAPAYSGHHEQMQHNSNVSMAKAISRAKIINSQNRKRFSAR